MTRKITSTVARIKAGRARELRLGTLEAKRDWATRLTTCALCTDAATAGARRLRGGDGRRTPSAVLRRRFGKAGLDYEQYVKIDEKFYRPAEVDLLVGDSAKARGALGWEPRYTFERLVDEMVEADLAEAERTNETRSPSYAGGAAGVS